MLGSGTDAQASPGTKSNEIRRANGGANASLESAVRRTTMALNDLSKTLDAATQRVRAATEYARGIADALFGTQPEQEGNAQIEPPVNSKFEGLGRQANCHHFALSELEAQLNRFEPLRG